MFCVRRSSRMRIKRRAQLYYRAANLSHRTFLTPATSSLGDGEFSDGKAAFSQNLRSVHPVSMGECERSAVLLVTNLPGQTKNLAASARRQIAASTHLTCALVPRTTRRSISRTRRNLRIEEMDRIFFRLFLIGTCIVDDVRSDHDVEFLIREHFLQSAKVRRVRDIDRRVVREQMHIKFIRDRHVLRSGGEPDAAGSSSTRKIRPPREIP